MQERWVQAFKVGKHTDVGGHVDEFTTDDLDGMVQAFEETYPALQPPLYLGGHENDMGMAPGWVTGMKREGERLLAKVKMAPVVFDAVEKELYKTVSPRIDWNKKIEGKRHPRVLTHLALLGKSLPAVKGMADLQTYFSEPESLTRDSTDATRMYQENLVHEELTEEDEMDLAKQNAELLAKVSELTVEKAGLETANRAELDTEKAKVAAFEEAETKRKAVGVVESVRTFCEGQVEANKMPPAARELLLDSIKDTRSYSEDGGLVIPWDTVREFAEAMTITKPGEGEGGEGGGGEGDSGKSAEEQLIEATEELTAKGMSFSEALHMARDNNPELTRQYVADTGGPGGE